MTDGLLKMFRAHGGALTLSQILQSPHAAEYRKEICFLRKAGYAILLEQNRKSPGGNLYRLVESEPSGQMRFA